MHASPLAYGILFAAVAAITTATAEFNETDLESLPGVGLPVTRGTNMNGESIFTNYINAMKTGQFFLVSAFNIMYEKPATNLLVGKSLSWCMDIQQTDFTSVLSSEMSSDNAHPRLGFGFSARCVFRRIIDRAVFESTGASLLKGDSSQLWSGTALISSVYSPEANGMEMIMAGNADNVVIRCLDDGTSLTPYTKLELHDEGDIVSSSFSAVGTFEWITNDDAADLDLFKTNTSAFEDIYADVWARNNDLAAAGDDETFSAAANKSQDQKFVVLHATVAFVFAVFF